MKVTLARSLRSGARSVSWADGVMFIAVLIWGGNFAIVKATLQELSPLAFNAMRFTLAAIVETAILLAMRQNLRMPWRDMRRMLPVALVGVAIYQFLFVFGISRSSAGNTSVVLATIPVFIALYAVIFKKQSLGRAVWLGILLTFAGIAVLTLGSGKPLSASLGALSGTVLILLAAMAWTVYTVGSQWMMENYSPIKVTALCMVVSAPVMVGVAIPDLIATPWAGISLAGWGGLLYTSVLSVAVAYLLWNVSVQRLGEARAAVYSNLIPVLALVTAWVALGERLTLLQLIGAVIVLAGIWLARFTSATGQAAAGEESL